MLPLFQSSLEGLTKTVEITLAATHENVNF